jgi:hypothetical protein
LTMGKLHDLHQGYNTGWAGTVSTCRVRAS